MCYTLDYSLQFVTHSGLRTKNLKKKNLDPEYWCDFSFKFWDGKIEMLVIRFYKTFIFNVSLVKNWGFGQKSKVCANIENFDWQTNRNFLKNQNLGEKRGFDQKIQSFYPYRFNDKLVREWYNRSTKFFANRNFRLLIKLFIFGQSLNFCPDNLDF